MTEALELRRRGLEAIEADDVDAAQAALDAMQAAVGPDDPARQHLEGVFAWACGDLDDAERSLAAAADRATPDPQAAAHFAELALARLTRLVDAEAALRAARGSTIEDAGLRDETTLLLAQCRLADDDPDEALELLDGMRPSDEHRALWAGTRAEALAGLDRLDEAVASLRGIEGVEQDADLQYLLGAILLQVGQGRADAAEVSEAAEAWGRALALDAATDDELEALEADEAEALRSVVEETMSSLPQPVLERLARATVEIVTRVDVDDVRAGADPRGFVYLDATRAGPGPDAEVRRVVVQRNVLLEVLDDDDEIEEALVHGFADEVARVLGVELLGAAG